MSDSIQVAIKVRPLIKRERDENLPAQWTVVDKVIASVDPEKRRGESSFQFDHIFDPEKSNSDVFETVVRPIVDVAVKGFNGTVFAYGQTSSGKTYTMLGTAEEPGVIPMAVERMFDAITETCGREFLLRVSYLEIYNEKVNDLLDTSRMDLKLREDSNGLVQVLNCREEIANSPEQIMAIMKKGDQNRRIGETDMNERSSRSHTIFRITIESREQSSDSDGAIQVSQLNLVDLAGSERARQTNATGERFKEGTHINMSLSTLGLVIKQLSESSDSTKYINFRDSKLTRLLQASLGGNAMTTIICAVTPAAFDETLCTLSFASRAKSVKNKPQLNEVMSDAALLKRYKKQLAKLNKELERLKHEKGFADVQEMESKLQEKEHKLQETDRQNQMLEERIEILKNAIVSTGGSSGARDDSNPKVPKSNRRRTWAGGNGGLNFRCSLGFPNLPTIAETSCTTTVHLPTSNDNFVKKSNSRKSIIQTVNLNEESFETAFTDFELELIKVAKEREELTNSTCIVEEKDFKKINPRTENRVKFEDDVEIYRFSNGSNWSEGSTPDKNKTQETSPGTPKSILRERISYLTKEFNELTEFTTLEKQILRAEKLDFETPDEKVTMQKQIEDLEQKLEESKICQIELEKKLTDSMNSINELQQVQVQKEQLEKENTEIKKKLVEESNKLQNTNSLVNNLRSDTDTLMEKLIQKNNELAKLKERVVELERINNDIEKSVSVSINEVSMKKENEGTDTELTKLNEIIEEKSLEITKYRQFEEEMKLENERLQQALDKVLQSEKKSEECQTEAVSDTDDPKDAEIAKLLKVIEENTLSLANHEQIKAEMEQKIEQLQSCLDTFNKMDGSSQQSSSDNVIECDKSTNVEQVCKEKDEEIIKLKSIIEEKVLEIAKYKQLEEDKVEEIESLQLELNNLSNVEKTTDEEIISNVSQDHSSGEPDLNTLRTCNEASGLLEVIEMKSDEIKKYQESEEELRKEIARLQQCLENVEKIEANPEKDDEIAKQKEIIQEKDHEIEKYKKTEEELKNEVSRLQENLNVVESALEKVDQACEENQNKSQTANESCHNTDLIQEKDEQIFKLSEMLNEKVSEIGQLKKNEEERRKEIEELKERVKPQVQDNTESMEIDEVEIGTSDVVKSSEIDKMRETIEEKTLEIANYRESEQKMKEQIEELQKRLEDAVREYQQSQLTQKEKEAANDEKETDELEMRNQIKAHQEEIEILKQNAEVLTVKSKELESTIEELRTLNLELRSSLEEKTKEVESLHQEFDGKVRVLEENLNAILMERDELKEKLNSVQSADLKHDFEKETESLRIMVDKFKADNDALRKRIAVLETESPKKVNQSLLMQSMSTPPMKSSTLTSADSTCGSAKASKLEVANESPIMCVKEEIDTKLMEEIEFAKPEDVKPAAASAVPATVDSDEKKMPVNKVALESSSIFANMTYFDNMEVSQSFVQDNLSVYAGIDESKDISNVTASIDVSMASKQVPELKTDVTSREPVKEVKETEKSIVNRSVISSQSFSLDRTDIETYSMEELRNKFLLLEKDNVRLFNDLQNKIQEYDEILKFIEDWKQTLGKLQQTIDTLTNENMSTSRQLTEERERNTRVVNDFQTEIDALRVSLTTITEEKAALKNELEIVSEQLDSVRSTTPVVTDDDMKRKFFEYQGTIKSLTDENIELSSQLMEKIEELEKLKESKAQEYDHQCTYRAQVETLENENIELSSDLTEQIEECDKLKETIEVLKKQLADLASQSTLEGSDKNELDILKESNEQLTNELIELRTKVTQLSRENANLTSNFILDDSDEATATSLQNKSSLSSMVLEVSSTAEESNAQESHVESSPCPPPSASKKVKQLEEEVKELKLMNKKLSELKLATCSQCVHMKELYDCQRQLKLELKARNHVIADLEKNFKQKCVETDALRKKASEDFNASLTLVDSTLNTSNFEGANVTTMEENVHKLHKELEELKENQNWLSNQYEEKCNEFTTLQIENSQSPATPDRKDKRAKAEGSARKNARIQALSKVLDTLSQDLQSVKSTYSNVRAQVNKLMEEKSETESLKLANEELQKECNAARANVLTYEDKVKLLEEELAGLYKRLEAATAAEKEMQAQKLETEVRLESALREKSELASSASDTEQKLQKELGDCQSLVQSRDKEIEELKDELQKLEDSVQQLQKGQNDNYLSEKLREEIDSAKSRIVQEIKGLGSLSKDELKVLPKKPVIDIFVSFLNAILSKETEIVKTIQEKNETLRRKLMEEKQQCIEAEQRSQCWAKTLENDNEKLQLDLTEQEKKNRKLEDKLQNLEHYLKEAQHENSQLHSNIANLEADLNQMYSELEKKSKSQEDRDSALGAAQEREKMAKKMEVEWENRLAQEKEEHERELAKLNDELESYKSICDDLKNTIEGLDLEIEHLKNTSDIKTDQLLAAERRNEELEGVIAQMGEDNQQFKNESLEKDKCVEELKNLLKIKCDLLTEYKTNVETMKPENESLQAQLAERKMSLERCKEEMHNLKMENKKQLDVLQDKLTNEEIKSAGLSKQIAELKNKNTQLCTTIEEFRDRCSGLEQEIASLQRKVRNSTSKVRVENEMQELQDENRSLKNHLEGSYNRIKELQESKSQAQRELMEAHGKNEMLEQELNNTKIALDSLREKYNNVNLQKLREKYETLLQEKNHVIREVEEKRMLLAAKDQKLVEYGIELDTLRMQVESMDRGKSLLESKIAELADESDKLKENFEEAIAERERTCQLLEDEKFRLTVELENSRREVDALTRKNKELDEEMDDMAADVIKLQNENAELFDKVITGSSSENIERIKNLEDEKEKLQISLRVAEVKRSQLEREIVRLNSEKEQLLSKIEDMNDRYGELESRFFDTKASSRGSSKNSSPTSRKKRVRQRRSDLFNQSRNVELASDSRDVNTDNESPSSTPTPPPIVTTDSINCQTCNDLRNRLREMSLDIISKNNKIAMLEVQLQSENFPYQIKYNELQGHVLSLKTKNSELKLEIQKLQRVLLEDSSRECQICRQRKFNKRDQGVQAKVDDKIHLSGMSSGAVEDHLKIVKLEKERNMMKELCRSRAKKIKELERRIMECEGSNNGQTA